MNTVNILKERGFTLIELLIAIAIIGLLTSIVIASLATAKNKNRDSAIKAQLKQIQTQAELYYDTAGAHPTAGNGKYSSGTTSTSGTACNSGTGYTTSMFNNPAIRRQIAIVAKHDAPNSTTLCRTNGTGQLWAVSISALAGGGSWCIDNSGKLKSGSTAQTSGTCS